MAPKVDIGSESESELQLRQSQSNSCWWVRTRAWSCIWSRVRVSSCWWAQVRARDRRASCRRFNRSPSRACHGASVIYASCEGSNVSKIAWCIRSFAAPSRGDMFTRVWISYGAEYNLSSRQWERFASACCRRLARDTIDYSRLVAETSLTPTTLVQPWRISFDSLTTTLAWLRIHNFDSKGSSFSRF